MKTPIREVDSISRRYRLDSLKDFPAGFLTLGTRAQKGWKGRSDEVATLETNEITVIPEHRLELIVFDAVRAMMLVHRKLFLPRGEWTEKSPDPHSLKVRAKPYSSLFDIHVFRTGQRWPLSVFTKR